MVQMTMMSIYRVLLIIGSPAVALRSALPVRHSPSSVRFAQPSSTQPSEVNVAVLGATGYIGKAVVRECVRRGYRTKAVVRTESLTRAKQLEALKGADVIGGSLASTEQVRDTILKDQAIDVIISCIASRSGAPADSWAVDYAGNLHALDATLDSVHPLKHYIMLSAYCVRKPELVFQHAKLKFEDYLRLRSKDLTYTIIRPTAFFKSVSSQVETVQKGYPYIMFGDGKICSCNPIAESDLATYIVNAIDTPSMHNNVLNVGGPDEALSPKRQAEILFDVLGKKPNYVSVPIGLFDNIIGFIDLLAKFVPGAKDAAELARIGKYYAVEDMLTSSPSEKFGRLTLRQHFERVAAEGQEYDPYTSFFGQRNEIRQKT